MTVAATIGLAINRDEYVPDKMPINKTKQKALIVVPPKKISEEMTMIVVKDVLSVRIIVWLKDILTMCFGDSVS